MIATHMAGDLRLHLVHTMLDWALLSREQSSVTEFLMMTIYCSGKSFRKAPHEGECLLLWSIEGFYLQWQVYFFVWLFFWWATNLKIYACSTEHNQNAPIYSAYTNPVAGTKSPDANLIILCRCVSWSRNSNRVRLCDRFVDCVCSTESRWCTSQMIELVHFSLSCFENIFFYHSVLSIFTFVFYQITAGLFCSPST